MDLIQLAVPFFILAMALEFAYGRLRGQNTYRLNDTINSLSVGVLSTIMDLLRLGFATAVFAALVSWLNISQWSMDAAWQWLLAFVTYDLCYYWKHRFGHELRIMWASHVAHHQSEEYNLSTALRQSGTDYIGFVFYLPLYLAGVPAAAVLTVGGLNLIYQFWVHTRHVGELGPLEYVFVTPSNHRVHHARNPEYLDKNYGGVFIVWDRLFGSYQRELPQLPCEYGITTGLGSWNPLWANLHVWVDTAKLAWRTRSWRDKLTVWFKPPGWLPADLAEQVAGQEPEPRNRPLYNPPLIGRIGVYVFFQFWLITAVSIWALAVQADLSRLSALVLFAWMLLSLCSLGMLMENRPRALRLEGWRLLASAALPVLPLGLPGLSATAILSAGGLYAGLSGALLYWLTLRTPNPVIAQGEQAH